MKTFNSVEVQCTSRAITMSPEFMLAANSLVHNIEVAISSGNEPVLVTVKDGDIIDVTNHCGEHTPMTEAFRVAVKIMKSMYKDYMPPSQMYGRRLIEYSDGVFEDAKPQEENYLQ